MPCGGGGHGGVLLDIEDVPHGQPPSQYPLRYHQLSGGVSDLPQKCLFALAYASNDIVLIALWVLASLADTRYLSVVVCFVAFLVNDLYGFINWRRMKERQRA